MMILGICGSQRSEENSGTFTLIKTVLEASACEYELISLRGKKIAGCTCCLGCVQDNICKVKDDMTPLREKIVAADAYVIGGPNFYSGMNAATHAFLERWYQFRHRTGNLLWGKLAVAVGVGGAEGCPPADDIEKIFLYSFIETTAKVVGQGAAACYSCGYGETCKVGLPYLIHGEGVKITDEMIPNVAKQPQVIQSAVEAGKELGRRLRNGHDRNAVTQKMQAVMMEKFKSST